MVVLAHFQTKWTVSRQENTPHQSKPGIRQMWSNQGIDHAEFASNHSNVAMVNQWYRHVKDVLFFLVVFP
jgi:hypothetical protein